jgi:hypothetical protein
MGIAQRYTTGVCLPNRQYTDASDNNFVTRTALVKRQATFKINYADGTALVTTGITLPVGTIIDDYPIVNVRTAEVTGTTKTINVGLTGTAAGLISGLSVAATGIYKPTQLFGAVTLGSLLLVNTASGANPTFEPYVLTSALAVTWTPASANFAQLDADVILSILVPVDCQNIPVLCTIPGLDSGN